MEISQDSNSKPVRSVNLKHDLIPRLREISSKESRFSSLTLLIVTIVLFFSSQVISVKWQEILILIGVLFVHEAGHLAAMKLLRYNDVKMFFIPFLGAAVSGKSLNDTAVKSCLVSLMGPFPGIVLSILLYILGGMTHNYYLYKTGQVMMLLNAFNFLPIMPLDGGRYIDVLFINRRYFRFLFTFAGAAVFLFLAISAKDIIIGIVGLFTVYIALSNFKLHGISNDLKSRGIKAASVNDLIEDEGAMQVVIDKFRAAYPKLFSPATNYRAIFSHLKVIVDTIKFVPAKLLPKTILLITYLVLVLASIATAFFFLGMNLKETARTVEINGKSVVLAERYVFGKKRSECPIDAALYYQGKGTGFDLEGRVSDIYYYKDGYRSGEWLTLNKAGQVIAKETYDKGRLQYISRLEGGRWKTYSFNDLSSLRKYTEKIKEISQPFKSNYKYFEN